ncbi:hypothetical protein Ahy_A06g025860 [Arachis hypogaea]|uniref:RING-CH-type domain-containing protein n=1 Tax=Arachis hypogaea TaxID=3818 RepID=A0A445CIV0_ARAHY|nr:hypothetical protein Ahy_A06g025860 [Arachis hypogaea]
MATQQQEQDFPMHRDQVDGITTTATVAHTAIHKGVESSEITELPSRQHGRRQNLMLEIPARNLDEAREEFLRINMPSTSPAFSSINELQPKNKSNIKALIPKLSFKLGNTEKASILALEGSSTEVPKKPMISRTLSLTKLITPRGKKMSSLPVTPIGGNTTNMTTYVRKGQQSSIHRSRSVPALNKDGNTSVGVMLRIVPTTPRLAGSAATTSMKSSPDITVENEDGEDIPEEEAVCRICLIELGEGSDTLKMEFSCKGELALAHQECVVKWFSIKGNRTCDVCKEQVQNLPVTLLRIASTHSPNFLISSQGQQYRQEETLLPFISYLAFSLFETHTKHNLKCCLPTWVWETVPILVVINMMAYFCFVEQLLVSNMGSGAIAISLPFSCILGLLSSMTSTTMVLFLARRKHVWLYAIAQFVMVFLAGRLFYSLLHVQAVLSMLLATFTGFGAVMCVASVLFEFLKWRRRWFAQLNQHQLGSQEVAVSTHQSSATTT